MRQIIIAIGLAIVSLNGLMAALEVHAVNDCLAGTYYDSNSDSCIAADPGYYVPVANATTQTPASPGFFVSTTAAITMTPASLGHFVPITAAITQTQASPGFFVPTIQATFSLPCPPGRYQPAYGQSACLLADYGYYVPYLGSNMQSACPVNTTTLVVGATSVNACIPVLSNTLTSTHLLLTWGDAPSYGRYQLWRSPIPYFSPDDNNPAPTLLQDSALLTYQDTDPLTTPGLYFYVIRAINGDESLKADNPGPAAATVLILPGG